MHCGREWRNKNPTLCTLTGLFSPREEGLYKILPCWEDKKETPSHYHAVPVSGSFCSIKNLLIAALVTKEQHAVVGLLGVYRAGSPLGRQRDLIGSVFLEDAIKRDNQLVSTSNNGDSLQNGRENPNPTSLKAMASGAAKNELEVKFMKYLCTAKKKNCWKF